MKAWQVGALVTGGTIGVVGLLSRVLGRRRRRPSHWTVLGQPETAGAWTPPSVEPGIVSIVGPTRIPIPEMYWRLGLAVAGVSPGMMIARVLYTPDSPIQYWLEVQPKVAGTTTVGVVDATGALAHIALAQEVA